MPLTEDEKAIIQKYFASPQDYIQAEHIKLIPENLEYPDGTKITRGQRTLILPQQADEEDIVIPIKADASDPVLHAATIFNNQRFFHQNAADSKDLLQTSAHSRDYYKDSTEYWKGIRACKTVVKSAINIQGQRYCLHSKSVVLGKFFPDYEQFREVRKHVGYFLSETVAFRNNETYYKSIDIEPYHGQTLETLLNDPTVDKTVLPKQLMLAYLEQIADKNIVHTDINPNNICVNEAGAITFIDFENAFIIDKHQSKGLGTPGYMAFEFFKRPEDCLQQMDIRRRGEADWLAALHSNFRSLFTPASDIFALGQVLLNDLQLPHDHEYHALATQMICETIENRPSGEKLRDALNNLHYSL